MWNDSQAELRRERRQELTEDRDWGWFPIRSASAGMVRLRTVDAFAERPFSGSPAAVLVLDETPPDDWMAALARETNPPDTGFVIREALPDADFRLRWFTPTTEVDLCGHATLASAHCLRGRYPELDSLCDSQRHPHGRAATRRLARHGLSRVVVRAPRTNVAHGFAGVFPFGLRGGRAERRPRHTHGTGGHGLRRRPERSGRARRSRVATSRNASDT